MCADKQPHVRQLDLLVCALLAHYGIAGITLLIFPQPFLAFSNVPMVTQASVVVIERLTRILGCAMLAMDYMVLVSCVFPPLPDRRVLCGCLLFHSLCCMVQLHSQFRTHVRGDFGQPAVHLLFAGWLAYRLRTPISLLSILLSSSIICGFMLFAPVLIH